MANQLNLGGMYDSMEFPPYVFKEYPKMVTVNGVEKIVNNQREEIALLREIPTDELANDLTVELAQKDKEIAALRAQLEAANTPSVPPKGKEKDK